MKRVFYSFGILIVFLIFLPIMAIIALCVVVDSGLPILFRQQRIGKSSKPFRLYKFRTMQNGAERKQSALRHLNEADGPAFKIYNDPRYTKAGKFLAHTGLDELPQLWNVIRGDMALIGPRPLPVFEAAKLKTWQQKRLMLKPGIISPWILEGYHTQTFTAWMKSDIAYAKKKNFLYDFALTGRSVVFLFRLFVKELAR